MSLFTRLFGGGAAPDAAAEDYKGYRITPTPIAEGQQYRLSARVEREVGDETKTHNLVRADTVAGLEAAQAASVEKAQQVIDALGDGIFK